jgi:uncharacterized ParB-like nuclease family protein
MEHGGRILGPFTTSSPHSILWMNKWWDNESLTDRNWNIGGERLWIAPEIQYCIKDREHIHTSYSLPKQMDPGNYKLKKVKNCVCLETKMSLEAHNKSSQLQKLSITRIIEPLPNPLRTLKKMNSLMEGVFFSGYNHTVELKTTTKDPQPSEPWSVMQVRQGGISIIPTYGTAQIGWYYRPKTEETIHIKPHQMRIDHKPNDLFKIGIHNTSCTGRVGYLNNNQNPYLIVRNYFTSPSHEYVEEPFDSPGENGYAFHLYNSNSSDEQFAEIECHGPSVGGKSKLKRSSSTFETYFFEGKIEQLRAISHELLSYDT